VQNTEVSSQPMQVADVVTTESTEVDRIVDVMEETIGLVAIGTLEDRTL
jgi:hypothetical protein